MSAYFGRRAAGILLFASDTRRVLLLQRSQHVKQPGVWSIPGGKVESGESLYHAALSELFEECGRVWPVVVDAQPCHIFRAPQARFSYYTFRGRVPEEFVPRLNWESDAYRWADPSIIVQDETVHENVRRVLATIGCTHNGRYNRSG